MWLQLHMWKNLIHPKCIKWNKWAMYTIQWCIDDVVLLKTRLQINNCSSSSKISESLFSELFSELFSTTHCWERTQNRQYSNLCWHKVTPDDARISNKARDSLCRSAKAAPDTPMKSEYQELHSDDMQDDVNLPETGSNGSFGEVSTAN